MKIRTISGACFIAIIAGFFLLREFVNPALFNILIWFFMAVGTFEVARSQKQNSDKFGFILSLVYGISIMPIYGIIEYFLAGFGQTTSYFVTAVFLVIALIYVLVKNKSTPSAYILPLVYPSLSLLCMALVNGFIGDRGFIGLLLIFVISPCADTFAYLVGMTYNKIRKGQAKKLCPKLSPKKTVAGAIGGIIGGAVGAIIVQAIFNPQLGLPLPYLVMSAIGIGASILTEIGDLYESYIKRQVGIKDMGKIMPGHGGVMDRIDGICFASVFMYIVFRFI